MNSILNIDFIYINYIMVKLSKNLKHCLLFSLLILGIAYLIKCTFNKSIREGIVFTPYDNKMLFTKPWSQFCVPPPPSCNKNLPNAAVVGSPQIGCNCKGVGDAGNLDPKCDGTNHLYFFN